MSPLPVRDPERRSGPLGRLRDVVDRSIGMYVLRRLTGRPTNPPDARRMPSLLDPDEIARRIGAAGDRPQPRVAHAVAAGHPAPAPLASAERKVSPAPRPTVTTPDVVRRRLVRDSGIALAGIAAVAFLAVTVLPPAQGGVLGATGMPGDEQPVAPTPTVTPLPAVPS